MKQEELDALKADLRSKYPNHKLKPVYVSTMQGGEEVRELVVIRSASMAERTQFLPKVKRNEDAAAYKQLVLQCTVYPARDKLDHILELSPFCCEDLANKIYELGGGKTEDLGEF